MKLNQTFISCLTGLRFTPSVNCNPSGVKTLMKWAPWLELQVPCRDASWQLGASGLYNYVITNYYLLPFQTQTTRVRQRRVEGSQVYSKKNFAVVVG